ncbi:MAG: hypothetical protein ACREA2_03945 [Blastocatellia bacterium]
MKKTTKKTKREPRDVNELAFDIVSSFTSEDQPADDETPEKNPVAVARGKSGGKVGGKARAAKLSVKKRKAIAKKAAKARWRKSS